MTILSQNHFFNSSGTCPLFLVQMGLIQNSLFWFSWDWSKNYLFHSSGTYPYILILLLLGLIQEPFLHNCINPRYILYMTLGQTTISHFLTTRTDPNVTFELHSIALTYHMFKSGKRIKSHSKSYFHMSNENVMKIH